jgi:hypothetical protein
LKRRKKQTQNNHKIDGKQKIAIRFPSHRNDTYSKKEKLGED